eukprot:6790325-Prymnesium_polylepis.1
MLPPSGAPPLPSQAPWDRFKGVDIHPDLARVSILLFPGAGRERIEIECGHPVPPQTCRVEPPRPQLSPGGAGVALGVCWRGVGSVLAWRFRSVLAWLWECAGV